MLDLNFVRQHPDKVRQACQVKNLDPQIVDEFLTTDQQYRQLLQQVEGLRAQRNQLQTKLKQARTPDLIDQSKQLKAQLADLEPRLRQLKQTRYQLALQLPGIPLPEVPVGKDEADNQVIRTWGQKPKFDFQPKDHIELGTKLGILDLERGSKVAGFRGYFLKGKGAIMQLALMRYALDKFTQKGYIPMIAPAITKEFTFYNTGHFPWGIPETYKLTTEDKPLKDEVKDKYYLAGTAEIPLVSYYANETLKEKDLPLRLVGFSPCFRREAGSYGKDTRGFYRVHEFWKVEQVVIGPNDVDISRQLHDEMLSYTEELQQELGLPYRVLLMCTGDMGEPHAKKYDIETWMPGRGSYGETASDSIMLDFQSRRANIKYQAKDGTTKYVHMLNNTALPSTRILIALWENYQQADGTIKVPEVLVPYTGFKIID